MAGYSKRPLVEKLGIRPGARVAIVGAPEGYESTLGPLPEGVVPSLDPPLDFIHLFAVERAVLERGFSEMKPKLAAGGMLCGRSMAAAFALGAEGIQLGTRMVSSAESPVHEAFKRAIVESAETDTVFLNRYQKPGLRVIRTPHSEKLERVDYNVMGELGNVLKLYFGGDMQSSVAISGQVIGRIEGVEPVAGILAGIMREFYAALEELDTRYAAG